MINPGKPPPFDGISYTDWAHRMELISLLQDAGK